MSALRRNISNLTKNPYSFADALIEYKIVIKKGIESVLDILENEQTNFRAVSFLEDVRNYFQATVDFFADDFTILAKVNKKLEEYKDSA